MRDIQYSSKSDNQLTKCLDQAEYAHQLPQHHLAVYLNLSVYHYVGIFSLL